VPQWYENNLETMQLIPNTRNSSKASTYIFISVVVGEISTDCQSFK